MKQVVVFYNPYLPELKVTVDGKKVATYSALMSSQHQRLEKWSGCLFAELYREANAEYEMCCISTEFVCNWLEAMARKDAHCVGFTTRSLPMDQDVYGRLGRLELLGCDEASAPVLVPVVNASGNEDMTAAVFEVLEEQGIFEDISEEGISWTDCPLVELEIRPCKPHELPYKHPVVIAFCLSPEDEVRLDTDAPVYALVMGTETKWLKQSRGVQYFSVEPDDLGALMVGILEEEVLCPQLSQLAYHFPEASKAFLTEEEKEALQLVCQATPICTVTLPRTCEVGRNEPLTPVFCPAECQVPLRIVSDAPELLEGADGVLQPLQAGSVEVAVFMGDDPYPVAAETIWVRQRLLISEIRLFPGVLYLPVGGQAQVQVSWLPENAENKDEIRWECSDASIASVDSDSGTVVGLAEGRCSITIGTPEAKKQLSLEVQPEIQDVECPCAYMEMKAGEQKQWRFRVIPENAYGADQLRVISSDKSVADYRGGYVIGVGAGECRIYVKNESGTISRELKVSVKRKGLW